MISSSRPELLHRLRRASGGELVHRIRKKLAARELKAALMQERPPFAIPPVDPVHIAALEMPALRGKLDDGLRQGLRDEETFTLNAEVEAIEKFEERQRGRFFDQIRPGPADPDLRAVWEPARLQNAALLLVGGNNPREERKLGKAVVLKWIQANPFLRGPHYMSAMECGLRVPVFFYCLKAAPDLSDEERGTLLRAVFEHGWWIEKNLSLFASLGNHTVCECVGLIFAGAVFWNTGGGRRWVETCCRLLDQELKHQVLADGGPAEQSLAYHRFVLDLYWLAADFLEKNRLRDCAAWNERLLKGEAFLSAFACEGRPFPIFGDSDDGHAVAPGAAPVRAKVKAAENVITTFAESGYTIIRAAQGLTLTFDHGPLGMAPLYNHGHADALSLTLSLAGEPILVDPGTYRYNGVPEWRRYFKGTRAHNTVTVDGQDQAVQATGFIWSRPYNSRLLNQRSGNGWVLLHGSHDGYKRLSNAVIHERTIFLEKGTRILIKDSFRGQGYHDFELNFHLHPDAVVEEGDGWITTHMGGVKTFIPLVEGGSFEVIRGQEKPVLGWYSPAYGVKVPSPVLSCRVRRTAEAAVFITVVALGGPCNVDELKNRFRQIEQQTLDT